MFYFVEEMQFYSKGLADTLYLSGCKISREAGYNPAILSFFDDIELHTFNEKKNEQKRHNLILSRLSAKLAVSKWRATQSIDKITFSNGCFSQPFLIGDSFSNISVSITHCDDIGLAISFSEYYLAGIDFEKVQERVLHAIQNQLTQLEIKLITECSSARVFTATVFWAAKEALSKALRIGFTSSLETFEIESIQQENQFFICRFKYFLQFTATCYPIGEYVLAIVLTTNSHSLLISDSLHNQLLQLV